jgi:hypothetical protein
LINITSRYTLANQFLNFSAVSDAENGFELPPDFSLPEGTSLPPYFERNSVDSFRLKLMDIIDAREAVFWPDSNAYQNSEQLLNSMQIRLNGLMLGEFSYAKRNGVNYISESKEISGVSGTLYSVKV